MKSGSQQRVSRLFYLDDIPTPYRLSVQSEIAAAWPGPFRIAYCAASEPGRTWNLDFSGLDVEFLSGWQYRPKRQVNPFSFKINPGILRALSAWRPDVVVLSGYVQPTMLLAGLWCLWHKIPYGIASETSSISSPKLGLRLRVKKGAIGWLIRGMRFGLPVGGAAAVYFKLLGATSTPMFEFPNTPDNRVIAARAAKFRASDGSVTVRSELGLPDQARIVLFVGRMISAKRPGDVVRAFASIWSSQQNTVLVMVGDGPLLDELRKAAPGRVFFTGWLKDPERIAELMAVAAMLVLPSEHETWGAVVNEAMAAGTPVIASDRVGSAAELIEPGKNGLIVPVGDIKALATAIERLLINEPTRKEMGALAGATAMQKGVDFALRNFLAGAKSALDARARET